MAFGNVQNTTLMYESVVLCISMTYSGTIKYPGPRIFSVTFSPEFLACATEKNIENFPGTPKYDAKHWTHVYFWLATKCSDSISGLKISRKSLSIVPDNLRFAKMNTLLIILNVLVHSFS